VADDVIQAQVLKTSPVPGNAFLSPPDADEYIEDMVNDNRALWFLKLQDQSLRHVQKKLA
jgi:hypothetical protein